MPGFNGGAGGVKQAFPSLSWGSGRSLVFQAGRRVGKWESGYKDKLAQGLNRQQIKVEKKRPDLCIMETAVKAA